MTVAEQQAEQAQQRYLELLRQRVAWQAVAAYGQPEPEPAPALADVRPAAVETTRPSAGAAPVPRTTLPTLWQLEGLVAANRESFPERAPEWEAYLFQLREHADTLGFLPERLGAVVETAFADLLGG